MELDTVNTTPTPTLHYQHLDKYHNIISEKCIVTLGQLEECRRKQLNIQSSDSLTKADSLASKSKTRHIPYVLQHFEHKQSRRKYLLYCREQGSVAPVA
jgi:alpha-D-ribose 1-methylphosphonate 5-triphosphate diphosphatase PhnM